MNYSSTNVKNEGFSFENEFDNGYRMNSLNHSLPPLPDDASSNGFNSHHESHESRTRLNSTVYSPEDQLIPSSHRGNNDYYNNSTVQQPPNKPTMSERVVNIFKTKPVVVYILSIIQIIVFLAEFIRMGVLTGSPIQTKPLFNPMIGPSGFLQINMGARFTPCMHRVQGVTDIAGIKFPCPNSTSTDTNVCSLSELCGMGMTEASLFDQGGRPNQWWRFITPIFLHAGILHIFLNLLLQLKLGSELEKGIGHLRFLLIYMASGIGGFVLGGAFTPAGIVSTGASGSLFGVIALDLLDLLFNWQLYERPKRALFAHCLEIVISFGIGLLPGLDNFSHIGGFAVGLLLGIALLRSPLPIRRALGEEPSSLATKTSAFSGKKEKFTLSIHKYFSNPQSPLWYGWTIVRLVALALTVTYFVVLIRQFETDGGGKCGWCKYLSCIPVKGWCDIGNITTETTTTSSTNSMGVLTMILLWNARPFGHKIWR